MKNTDLLVIAYGSVVTAMLTTDKIVASLLAALATFDFIVYTFRVLGDRND